MSPVDIQKQAQLFARDLEGLGFDSDDDVSGGDTVDVIGRYIPLLHALPALAELAVKVELLVKARGRFHTELNYTALAEALHDLQRS